MTARLLRNARLTDGRDVDVLVIEGRIAEVLEAGRAPIAAGVTVDELAGMLLVPAPAEPHAHLDKAFTADRVPNPAGDLLGAIVAWRACHATLEPADIAARAERAALAALANGVTAIRTHADLGAEIGLRSVDALVAVRDRLADLVDIQVVALAAPPITGAAGADQRARLRDALAGGVDAVGGCPHLEPEPLAAIEIFVELAAAHCALIDLHTDETLDPAVLCLRDYAKVIAGLGAPVGAAASHCVSLGVQPEAIQHEVARAVADAGVGVITLPQTNLFLQARGVSTGAPRGLTAIHALRAAGARVAGGADNLQDPFNTMGRADPMETAALLVMAGHLTAGDAFEMVSGTARAVMGLEPVRIEPGSPAELLAIDATNVREALASASGTRRVYHRGQLIATARRTVEFHDLRASAPR